MMTVVVVPVGLFGLTLLLGRLEDTMCPPDVQPAPRTSVGGVDRSAALSRSHVTGHEACLRGTARLIRSLDLDESG